MTKSLLRALKLRLSVDRFLVWPGTNAQGEVQQHQYIHSFGEMTFVQSVYVPEVELVGFPILCPPLPGKDLKS